MTPPSFMTSANMSARFMLSFTSAQLRKLLLLLLPVLDACAGWRAGVTWDLTHLGRGGLKHFSVVVRVGGDGGIYKTTRKSLITPLRPRQPQTSRPLWRCQSRPRPHMFVPRLTSMRPPPPAPVTTRVLPPLLAPSASQSSKQPSPIPQQWAAYTLPLGTSASATSTS